MQFILFALFAALAGRAMAFTFLTVGTTNFDTSEILAIPAGPVKDACASICGPADTQLRACNGETQCQCQPTVILPFRDCEQCWFTELIKRNEAASDPRVGSSPMLKAYVTECTNGNFTLQDDPKFTKVALALPPGWNGPFGLFLNVPATAFGCIIVAWMGVSAIWLLSNM